MCWGSVLTVLGVLGECFGGFRSVGRKCFGGFRSVGGSALEVLEVLGECFGGFRSARGVFWRF